MSRLKQKKEQVFISEDTGKVKQRTNTFKCSRCNLPFFDEDVGYTYSVRRKMCIRCVILEMSYEGVINLPDCFGVGHDYRKKECMEECSLKKGCLLEWIDERQFRWNAESKSKYSRNHISRIDMIVRILKRAGTPLHLFEIFALLEKHSNGHYYFSGTQKQRLNLQVALKKSTRVAHLGSEIYLWAGYWKEEDGGEIIYNETYLTPYHDNRRKGVKTIIKEMLDD